MVTFEVRRPDAMELCDVHFQNNPEKICDLRPDVLGYILNMANLNFESRVLLVENTRGLLAGAVIERGINYCLMVEFNQDKSVKYRNDFLYQMDIATNDHKAMSSIAANMLLPLNKDDPDDVDPLLPVLKKKFKKSFSSFIFVHDHLHPAEVFTALRQYLQPSASIAVYSQFLQPLTELMKSLLASKDTIDARIEELCTREHQVLPLRTHPHMSTNGRSGYVLTAVVLA